MKHLLYLLPLLFLIIGCSESNDNPISLDFELSSANPDISISDYGRNASIEILGYDADYTLGISGDFVNIVFDADVDWLSAAYSLGSITVHADAMDSNSADTRSGKINFTVFNDSKSASGSISVTQRKVTYADLLDYENKAINFFLSCQKVIGEIPGDLNFQTGANAPFYILSSNPMVAMRVIDKGSEEKPNDNDRVCFSFSRANLVSFYRTGEIVEDLFLNATSTPNNFRLNDFSHTSSAQWGTAIQMPFQFGIGYDAEVQLVVASPAGFSSEISYVIPYLYNVSYFKAEGLIRDEIPSSPVFIPFASVADWTAFAPIAPLTWQFFNKKSNIPSSYHFLEESATGFGGVLVVSDVYGMHSAYDAACPVECHEDITLCIDKDNMNAYCPVCGSRYDVFFNYGSPLSGKATELRCAPVRYNIASTSSFYKLITN